MTYLTAPHGAAWSGYTISGRMLFTSDETGIGVAAFAQSPLTLHTMYRLRRYTTAPEFHISLPGGDTCQQGAPTSTPPGFWYSFLFRVEDLGQSTRLQAKVWESASSEPAEWQIDCLDDSGSLHLRSGSIGAWAMGNGQGYWDDLVVTPL